MPTAAHRPLFLYLPVKNVATREACVFVIDFSAYIFETRLSKVALEKFPVNVEFPILFLRYLSLVYLGFSYSSIL